MIMKRKKIGILTQVAILFAISILASGIFTYYTQHMVSVTNVKKQTEMTAEEVAAEVKKCVEEYPAHEWLLRYWYEHSEELDIEYDAEYQTGTRTEEKCRLLRSHCPDLQLLYVTTEEIESLAEEDRKLYAEITYSWLITHVNQIKRSYKIDYLFCVSTDYYYEDQFFIFSAADPGAVRGRNYEEVYTLGTTVKVSESQSEAMRNAQKNYTYLADAGNYVDYYSLLEQIDDRILLIGMTFNMTDLNSVIHSQTAGGTSFAVFYQLFLSVICLALIAYFIIRPLKEVQQDIRTYSQTKNSKETIENLSQIRSSNEIGELAEDVIVLAREIDHYMEQIAAITAEEERISTELALAARIQESMLPNSFPAFPERNEFEIYASMDPAKEVGGDFYDFFFVDEDHLCLVIADVAGKGVPAAMFMTISMILLANMARMGKTPSEILEMANDAISPNNKEEMFVTVWMGILELSTGKLTAANAGHEYPVLMQPGGKFEIIKDRHGFVVGGMEDVKYHNYEMQLNPGARLFVYTDGLPEAMNAENTLFGTDRILKVLNQNPDETPEKILGRVTAAVNDFVKDAEQFDDLTMLCIHYKGPKN